MSESSRLASIEAARQRRVGAAAQRNVRFQWFIENVSNTVALTMKNRVRMATEYLRDKIVRNISVPVVKEAGGKNKRVKVIERSKPGEFPRADTTQLLKTLFSFVRETSPGVWDGYVGTPLDYGLFLELKMNRKFLTRTLEEERDNINAILTGPIK